MSASHYSVEVVCMYHDLIKRLNQYICMNGCGDGSNSTHTFQPCQTPKWAWAPLIIYIITEKPFMAKSWGLSMGIQTLEC